LIPFPTKGVVTDTVTAVVSVSVVVAVVNVSLVKVGVIVV
jgi:hypothetical protein